MCVCVCVAITHEWINSIVLAFLTTMLGIYKSKQINLKKKKQKRLEKERKKAEKAAEKAAKKAAREAKKKKGKKGTTPKTKTPKTKTPKLSEEERLRRQEERLEAKLRKNSDAPEVFFFNTQKYIYIYFKTTRIKRYHGNRIPTQSTQHYGES